MATRTYAHVMPWGSEDIGWDADLIDLDDDLGDAAVIEAVMQAEIGNADSNDVELAYEEHERSAQEHYGDFQNGYFTMAEVWEGHVWRLPCKPAPFDGEWSELVRALYAVRMEFADDEDRELARRGAERGIEYVGAYSLYPLRPEEEE